MTTTIEQLQKIAADENRTPEDRKQAAEHIIKLQESQQEPRAPEPVDPALAERRSHFSGAQRRLARQLSLGNRAFDFIDSNRSDATAISDQLVTMQIIRLMLDDDGSDGIIYAATNWKSSSKETLAERTTDQLLYECNPAYRYGMQTWERQRAYSKKTCVALELPYSEPKPVPKLKDIDFVGMPSADFAAFVTDFHRKVLQWNLKEYVYGNLHTPAKEFFKGFVQLQRDSDDHEEIMYKGAYAAHLRATDPDLGEEEAEDCLEMIRWMAAMQAREDERRAARIANHRPHGTRGAVVADQTGTNAADSQTQEGSARKDNSLSAIANIDIEAVSRYYDRQIAKLQEEQENYTA